MSNADINAEDLKAIMEQKQTLYQVSQAVVPADKQGLWWGGERIWLEDMVRLRKHRSELPADALGPPSEGATDRAVLLNIRRAISYLERSRVDPDRCITIEVSPDNTNETTTAWRCLLYGDVYEVAKASGFPFTPQSMDMKNGELSMVQAYTAPDGFEFKQLNDPGAEVTADILG